MAKGVYIGVSGVGRKVKQPYVGVSSVARKAKSGYVGVNGIARQFLFDVFSIHISYTGDFTDEIVTSDGKTYRLLTLTSSGTLTADVEFTGDIFMVGGGGAGGSAVGRGYTIADAAQGGAGGYINTQYNIALGGSNTCEVTIGAGGESVEANSTSTAYGNSAKTGGAGGATTCQVNSTTYTANGGGGGSAKVRNNSGISSRNTNGGGYGGRGYSTSSSNNAGVLNNVNQGFGFDETSGTHYGSGGGGGYRLYPDEGDSKFYAGDGASGGGSAVVSNGSVQTAIGGSPTAHGSGGGAAVNIAGGSTRRYAKGGNGMQGVVMIRIFN